ncbi:lytic polysaccharide monooxygenase auxiliary activity family 9 protein [Salinactinospora qingdaonensis]|uniref:Lytic polysaccharide monooxygenase n=1 Tax=Salinactinospora qingdaonensis TaxID=702744 RepID=A0ABP7F3I4_9ACTN
MRSHDHSGVSRWALRALALVGTAAVGLTTWTGTASAHGTIVDPPSRNYSCWERWGDDHQNPDMQQEDPMCWQAWQDNANAMWNWMGLYQNNVNDNHQAAVPDGQLCSGGHAQNGRYQSLDVPGEWKTTDVSNGNITLNLYDQAQHGADYFQVYVTKQGYDPTTEALSWNDLELVEETGYYGSASNYYVDINVSGRSGHHIIYTIWKAGHMDQNYYICSDVNFV